MKTKHTEEPWNLHECYNGHPLTCEADGKSWTFGDWRLAKGERILGQIDFTMGSPMGWPRCESREEALANAERVVACVNGCAGVENPAALGDALAFLRQIAKMNGNLPLDSLDGTCGPNDGASRGIKLRACIEFAQAALEGLNREPA